MQDDRRNSCPPLVAREEIDRHEHDRGDAELERS
jgi:hypothetical protein